jgi:hypothetical protein
MWLVVAAGIAASAVAVLVGVAAAHASGARACPSYIVRNTETFGGETYRYVTRNEAIQAKEISCSGAHRLIAKSYRRYVALRPEPGVAFFVSGWRCVYYRPFGGGPGGHFESLQHCQRHGGHYLSWTNYEISQHKVR